MPGSGSGGPVDGYGLDGGSGFWADAFGGLAEAIGGGAASGFGLGDAASGMAGSEGTRLPILDKIYQGATDAIAGQYPGYGVLWTYDSRDGVGVTSEGWMAVAAAGVALWWVLK